MTEQKSIYEEAAAKVARALDLDNAGEFRVQEILLCAFGPLLKAGVTLAMNCRTLADWTTDDEVAATRLLLSAKERI